MYDKQTAPLHKINHKNLVEGYIRGFGNRVGVYSNHATIIEAMKAMFQKPEQQPQRDELQKRKKLLREVVGAEIDSTKGLAKPKEPWEFTHFEKINDDDSDIVKAEKYYRNSLVISKKPYFFRYLYPELNKRFKQYENAYNEISKCLFGMKFKKLLLKENKTEQEKNLIRRYQRFCPVISSNCTMNNLCKRIENIDFDIKYNKDNKTLLPDYPDRAKNPDILEKFKLLYRKYCNKRALNYVSMLFEEDAMQNDDIRFSVIDATLAEIREDWMEMSVNVEDSLGYIHALARQYAKFNWAFAWDLLGDLILDCIDSNKTIVPVEDESGREFLGRKYILKEIQKDEEFNFEDFEDVFDEELE